MQQKSDSLDGSKVQLENKISSANLHIDSFSSMIFIARRKNNDDPFPIASFFYGFLHCFERILVDLRVIALNVKIDILLTCIA